MSAADSTRVDRRKGTRDLVRKLTEERTAMLVLFCRVAGLEPYTPGRPTDALLQEFCQLLVDYIAAGHFALYDRILNGMERRRAVVRVAEELYPQIAKTTDEAMAFNDKYEPAVKRGQLQDLPAELSRLGETLAARIELEDRIISALKAGP